MIKYHNSNSQFSSRPFFLLLAKISINDFFFGRSFSKRMQSWMQLEIDGLTMPKTSKSAPNLIYRKRKPQKPINLFKRGLKQQHRFQIGLRKFNEFVHSLNRESAKNVNHAFWVWNSTTNKSIFVLQHYILQSFCKTFNHQFYVGH